MSEAAIFDLDRTLLPGSSAPVFQRHLADAGIGRPPGAVMQAYYRTYDLFGENPLLMQFARLAVRASAGWSVNIVEKAAESAAEELVETVPAYAWQLLDEHRDAGRTLVLATTSPAPLVTPFAERLGLDVVLASRWVVDGDTFTGEPDGPFLWGRGKSDAVRAWAQANGVDLTKSYAYSDAAYDTPLLSSVGRPVAVNPDAQLTLIAGLNGWEIRHLDKPRGVVKIAGREIQDWLRPYGRPEFVPNAEFDISGLENIPSEGGAVVVFNHRSYFDPTAVGVVLAQSGRPARFLGKKEVFDAPIIGRLSAMLGGIRVDRGTGSDEPLDRAIDVLEAGDLIAMAPQGTIPRGPAFFDPELKGRWGAARLAKATRVPVIPVGLWGTEHVWPRNARLPRMSMADRPLVTVRVGPPVDLKYRSLDSDTKRIMTALVDLLPDEARRPHIPTADELARTYPPGYMGDPDQEVDRRPGTDT